MTKIELNNYGRMINLETEDHIVDIYEDCHSGAISAVQDNSTYIHHYESDATTELITHIEKLEYEKAIWVQKYFLLKQHLIELEKQLKEGKQ